MRYNEKALRGHPEGFLGDLTSLSIDKAKSSKIEYDET